MTTALTRSALVFSAFMFSAVGAQAAALAAQNGMTLYVFDKDKGDQSVCYDDCAVNWPPYVGTAADKMPDDWKLVQRTDGSDPLALIELLSLKGFILLCQLRASEANAVTAELDVLARDIGPSKAKARALVTIGINRIAMGKVR